MMHESDVENTIISLLQNKDYEFIDDSDEWIYSRSLDEFINKKVLAESLKSINNITDDEIINDAINKIVSLDNPSLFERNFKFS